MFLVSCIFGFVVLLSRDIRVFRDGNCVQPI